MNIIDALNSGKKFKRRSWTVWHDLKVRLPNLEGPDILADDWEIQEEKRELTWHEIHMAFAYLQLEHALDITKFKEKLGFTE